MMVALSEHGNVAIGRARLYTEVRRSEARFGSLIRNALDLITILDGDGMIRYESLAVERVLGYPPNELVGLNAFDLIHADPAVGGLVVNSRLYTATGPARRVP